MPDLKDKTDHRKSTVYINAAHSTTCGNVENCDLTHFGAIWLHCVFVFRQFQSFAKEVGVGSVIIMTAIFLSDVVQIDASVMMSQIKNAEKNILKFKSSILIKGLKSEMFYL